MSYHPKSGDDTRYIELSPETNFMTGTLMTSAVLDAPVATVADDARFECKRCGARVHAIYIHLRDDHANDMSVAEYQSTYPGTPIFSAVALARLEEGRIAKENAAKIAMTDTVSTDNCSAPKTVMFHELFGLGKSAATMGASGNPIPIEVLAVNPETASMIPEIDRNYVFNLDVLKILLMGIGMKIPTYLWGHSGVGKTTMFEQLCARTNRPLFRAQHTANMEEEHIVGGWRLRDGHTHFELGPLPLAMKNGWIYLADEYDFARPEVSSVYQAVLEGKPLVIKEADPANRVIRPHPNFRIIATGNTNGQGDDSGLYAGTNLQNAANYERFGIVEQMPYMDAALESRLVAAQARIPIVDAQKLVDYANKIRTEFKGGRMGNPISPRSLIYAGQIGVAKQNYRIGLEKSYINRLTPTDREVASQLAQRVFA